MVRTERRAQQGGGQQQFKIRENGAASLVDPVPEPESGQMSGDEPLADPRVRKVLRDAYANSNPGEGDFYDPSRKEQGGYIIRRDSAVGRFLFGEYKVQWWEPVGPDYIYPDLPPDNENVVCSFHTHPNNGAGYDPSASQADWTEWGHESTPHYIVSGSGVYRIGSDAQTYLGPMSILAR